MEDQEEGLSVRTRRYTINIGKLPSVYSNCFKNYCQLLITASNCSSLDTHIRPVFKNQNFNCRLIVPTTTVIHLLFQVTLVITTHQRNNACSRIITKHKSVHVRRRCNLTNLVLYEIIYYQHQAVSECYQFDSWMLLFITSTACCIPLSENK